MSIDQIVTQLRELEAKATPGDWKHESSAFGHAVLGLDPTGRGSGLAFQRMPLDNRCKLRGEDAQLIAAMRNALPRLLDELDNRLHKIHELMRKYRERRDLSVELRQEVESLRARVVKK